MTNKTVVKTKLQKNWRTAVMLAGVSLPMITGVASISADDNTSQGASTADKNKGIDVAVDHSKLDDAVKQAQAAGVKVATKDPKVITSNSTDLEKNQKAIAEDYDSQIKAITAAVEKQKKADADYNDKKAKADQVKAANQAADDKYQKDTEQYKADEAQHQKDMTKYDDDLKKYEADTITHENEDGKTQSNTSDTDQAMKMDKTRPVDNSDVEGDIKPKQTFQDKPNFSKTAYDGGKIMSFGGQDYWGLGESTGVAVFSGHDIIGKTLTKTYKNSVTVGGRKANVIIALTPTKFTGTSDQKPSVAISNNLIDNFNIAHASYKFQLRFNWSDDGKELSLDELNGANKDSKLFFLGGSLTPHRSGKANEYIQTNDAKNAYIGNKSFISNIKGAPQDGITSYYAVAADKTGEATKAQHEQSKKSGKGADEDPENFAQMVGVTFGEFTTTQPTFYGGGVNTTNGEAADIDNNHFMNFDDVAFNPRPVKPTPPTKPVKPTPENVVEPEKPQSETATQQLTTLLDLPTPTKDVKADETNDANAKSIDKQEVKVGDKLTYALRADALPKDRTTDVTSLTYSDKLPVEVDYESATVTTKDGKTDLSKFVTFDFNKETHEFTAKVSEDYLKQINQAKNVVQELPIIMVHVKANKANATFKNQYNLLLNDGSYQSNEVANKTGDQPKAPEKPSTPETPKTPNTSYGEKPKGLLYASLAAVSLVVGLLIFWKPIKKWFNK